MLQTVGDLWSFYGRPNSAIVIPTNIGWKKNQENVMGAGLAKDAARRFRNLPYRYGRWCELHKEETKVVYAKDLGLILFPTKPLDAASPHLSWRNPSTLPRITRSLHELVALKADPEHSDLHTIYIPLVGCGNGKLEESAVLPLMSSILVTNHFVLVRPTSGAD